MNLKQKKKQLIAAAMALCLSVGTTVPALIASAPSVDAAANKGSIMLDTANYIMAPGNRYDIGVTIKDANGNKLTANQVKDLVSSGKLKVQDSRTGSVASLEQLSNGNFRVTGKKAGTCYIVYDIGGTHASVKIDVQNGVKQHGKAVRHTSFFTKDVDFSREYYAEDFVGMTFKEMKSRLGTNYTQEGVPGGGVAFLYNEIPGLAFVFPLGFIENTKCAYISVINSGKINPYLRADFTLAQLENAAKNLKNVTIKPETYNDEMYGRMHRFSIESSNTLIFYDWYFDYGASTSKPASTVIVMTK